MTTTELLKKGLEELGISYSEEHICAFMVYLKELRKWNRAYNLTAVKDEQGMVTRHILDSLLYLRAIPEGSLELADAGSGAGFPGVPLKIIRPDLEVTLIESSRKKAAFLRHIIRTLGMGGISVVQERLENLGREHEGSYDIIVSRAAFRIREFLSRACPYAKPGGILVLNKGPKAVEEVEELRGSPGTGAVQDVKKVPLPFTDAQRNLVVLSCTMKQ
ncbi:MAG: 16S rRNA (guanine(527)-N(7))-methyltransferase RsmG [Nitrospiraceae bacterium]|nr:MAG: 16S rRNA (guanine(527)-N(7))-methyltransferase RsmG [Nitrospiraceae bacterium]